MKELYLIIDLGTGNSRVTLASPDGTICGILSFENTYYTESSLEYSKFFIPNEWFSKIIEAAKELTNAHPDGQITAITATSAREGIVLIDKQHQPFIGLPNIDRRGEGLLPDDADYNEIYRLSGRWSDTLFSALKLVGYKNMYPEKFENILTFTSLSEWIGYEFTKQIGIAPSHACETQLYDTGEYQWSDRLCHIHGIEPSILPKTRASGTILGTVVPEIARLLHLNDNIPFIISGADTQTAVRGVHAQDGDVVIVSGTTSPIITLSDVPLHDPQMRCWLDCSLDGKWLLETNAGTTGLNYQNYRNNFLPDMDYDEIEDALQCKNDFRCIASFGTKLFSTNRTLKKGGFYMSAPLGSADRIDLAYAILADIACGIGLHYFALSEIQPHQKNYILGCGGGFQSQILGQWISDLTQKDIILSEASRQASVQGCICVCNDVLKNVMPLPNNPMVIHPKSDSPIQDYYLQWKQFRKLTNSV